AARATRTATGAGTTTRTTTTTTVLALGRGFFSRLRCVVAAQRVALVDPDLDPDDAVGGQRLGEAVVDVSAQRVERHATFAVPLDACDLSAVQAARAHDLDALGPKTHRVLHCALHRATE